jgi:hypothetical protein
VISSASESSLSGAALISTPLPSAVTSNVGGALPLLLAAQRRALVPFIAYSRRMAISACVKSAVGLATDAKVYSTTSLSGEMGHRPRIEEDTGDPWPDEHLAPDLETRRANPLGATLYHRRRRWTLEAGHECNSGSSTTRLPMTFQRRLQLRFFSLADTVVGLLSRNFSPDRALYRFSLCNPPTVGCRLHSRLYPHSSFLQLAR